MVSKNSSLYVCFLQCTKFDVSGKRLKYKAVLYKTEAFSLFQYGLF
jgi:hypothetical protein